MYSVCTDAASSNLKASKELHIQNSICGSPTVHNILGQTLTQMLKKPTERKPNPKYHHGFAIFIKEIQDLLEQGSRRHCNAKLMYEKNYKKLKGFCNVRWGSLCDAVESIICNFEIIKKWCESNETEHIQNLKIEELQYFHAILLPMKKGIRVLETHTRANGQMVAPVLYRLYFYFIE